MKHPQNEGPWFALLGFEAHGRPYKRGDRLDDLDPETLGYVIRVGGATQDPNAPPLEPYDGRWSKGPRGPRKPKS